MARPQHSLGNLIWCGEHWLLYLRHPGTETDSARISLYHAYYSPGGEGTVAFVDIPGNPGFRGMCTDHRAFAQFIVEHMIRGRGGPWDRDLFSYEATFTRGGTTYQSPSWTIQTPGAEIVARWGELQPPLVGPPTVNKQIIFTVLTFADEGRVTLNGAAVEGKPYPREVWRQNLGTPHSSCVFALAETMIA